MRKTSVLLVVLAVLLGLVAYLLVRPGSAHAVATQTISAKSLDQTFPNCGEAGVTAEFVITQIDTRADAPGSITVNFSNGTSGTFDLSSFTGMTAHYIGSAPSSITSATAVIYAAWSGQFNLSHFACGSTTTTTAGTTTTTAGTTTTTRKPAPPPPVTTTTATTTATTRAPSTTTTVPVAPVAPITPAGTVPSGSVGVSGVAVTG